MKGMGNFSHLFCSFELKQDVYVIYFVHLWFWSQDFTGKLDSLSESYGDKSRQKTSKILGRMKPLRRQEKYAALRRASGFKSKRPFCKILMQPSYVHGTYLSFSSTFATRCIKKTSCNVILKALDGRTWTVKYIFGVYDRLRTARFISGWKEFSQDNNLEVGDVCAFVLLEGIKITFQVVIFRVNGKSNKAVSSGE
ncbi:B3 DNA binding domain containing protein [Trema orientale]|uniref:B3 DNA binding domain containing protein n=1 Tax=Trema orientale TaxID=63057 RepID=A0A2P5FY15_TREOI|nr:B3 DNA binding domain containing protein [Trema orientale]